MKKNTFNPDNLPSNKEEFMTELQVRELIAAALANYTGVVRFRNTTITDVNIADFTNAQHTHSNAAGGGQLNLNNVSTTPLTVPNGGTGVNTLTGIAKGNGAAAFTAIVPLAGTGTFYASATSGGAVTVKFDYDSGIIIART